MSKDEYTFLPLKSDTSPQVCELVAMVDFVAVSKQ